MHDTSYFYNNCLQKDYFTYNSLYHYSTGSEVDCDCVFQGLPSNSVPLRLTSWVNQKKSAKTTEKKRSYVRKCKHHGTTQPSYRSGRRRVLSPRDERTLVRKVQINPRTTAKDPLGLDHSLCDSSSTPHFYHCCHFLLDRHRPGFWFLAVDALFPHRQVWI